MAIAKTVSGLGAHDEMEDKEIGAGSTEWERGGEEEQGRQRGRKNGRRRNRRSAAEEESSREAQADI